MKENILMRILLCNIHCPFICFCKPSAAARLYAAATASGPSPLRLDSAPPQTAPCRVVCVSDSWDQSLDDAKDDSNNNGGLKSCIKEKEKATDSAAAEDTDKKKVEWVDSVGQELAEIREFESSDSGDMEEEEEEENQSMCASLCTIL